MALGRVYIRVANLQKLNQLFASTGLTYLFHVVLRAYFVGAEGMID